MRTSRAVVEALWIAVLGAALALLANAVSPRGLQLSRNYFPEDGGASLVAGASPATPTAPPAKAADAVQRRLEARGLQAVTGTEVAAWFRDPQYDQGLTVFVDARDEAHFEAGHIPGAWPFNHYRPESQLATVLPACLVALKVVVYCNGGSCEDSEFAAVMLRDAGVPRENLFVYPGGITEWTANGQPVEIGSRRSGRFRPGQP